MANFNFALGVVRYIAPVGVVPFDFWPYNFDFAFQSPTYVSPIGIVDFDFSNSGVPVEPPVEPTLPLPEIRSITSSRWERASPLDMAIKSDWQRSRVVDINPVLNWGHAEQLNQTISLALDRILVTQDRYLLNRFDKHAQVDNGYKLNQFITLVQLNKGYSVSSRQAFKSQDTDYSFYYTVPPAKDVDYTFKHNSVLLTGVERDTIVIQPPRPPTGMVFDFEIIPDHAPTAKANGLFDFSINQPVFVPDTPDPVTVSLPSVLQPTGSPFRAPFSKTQVQIDQSQTFGWGYGLNNFVIGGVTTITSRPDPIIPPEPDPPIVHINYEVYRVVNTVNITVRPSGQFLDFENFSITRDVESFAWTCTFDLLTAESYNLVRPVGRTLQTIDININGTIFTVFVGKANTSIRASNNGTTRVYRCTAWSNLKRLSYPYARRRSFTDSQARTAAQIATNELTGTGFTVDWQTVDWQVPAGVHTYQNKTSLGAVLGVVNGIGGVIVPDLSENTFTVRPYYPVSPWNWDDEFTQINRQMNESQFFSIDNDTIPRDNPNGVYVYGQEQGVGVFAVRLGTAGNELLPDVVDRYITANNAGQERGRIEVARNSFIELIPMSTYIDENGIIMPQELIEFTALDGTTWRGMVVQTTVNCSRVGTALTQQITIARFFDG